MKEKIVSIIKTFEETENVQVGIVKASKKKVYDKEVPFVTYSPSERRDPSLYVPDARSIIVLLLPLYYQAKTPTDMRDRGILSMEAIGIDYHILVREKLVKLWEKLLHVDTFNGKIFVDTGPMVERELLVEANLASYGKSSSAISPLYGSFCHCGYIISTMPYVELKKESSKEDICKDCDACIKSCPGNALTNGFSYKKCVSYVTQKKGELDKEESRLLQNALYGCDVCRLVCPHNRDLVPEIVPTDEMFPKVSEFLSHSQRSFRKTYKNRAFVWRGNKILKRNAMHILDNQKRWIDEGKKVPIWDIEVAVYEARPLKN